MITDVPFSQDLETIGHIDEFNKVIRFFQEDKDLLITGVPGSGRSALVKRAAQSIETFLIVLDCIRATSSASFTNLLLYETYKTTNQLGASFIEELLSMTERSNLFQIDRRTEKDIQVQLASEIDEYLIREAFSVITAQIERFVIKHDARAVIVFRQISHIRSWDRTLDFERYVRSIINKNPTVSYVTLETVAELEDQKKNKLVREIYDNCDVTVIELKPLSRSTVTYWLRESLHTCREVSKIDEAALDYLLDASDGHIASVEALFRQVITVSTQRKLLSGDVLVQEALESLLTTLSTAYESLLLSLPSSQLQLIECLAVEPTSKPHSKEYISKYGLTKGGSLRGALEGLQRKGLIYGSEDQFKLTLPLFSEWIRRKQKQRTESDLILM